MRCVVEIPKMTSKMIKKKKYKYIRLFFFFFSLQYTCTDLYLLQKKILLHGNENKNIKKSCKLLSSLPMAGQRPGLCVQQGPERVTVGHLESAKANPNISFGCCNHFLGCTLPPNLD